jgi:urease accessory protein
MRKQLTGGLAAILALLPMAAMAHTGTGADLGVLRGFLHPLTGLDHILAMVAVGVFAAQLCRRSIWAVPAAFVVAMAAGAPLGYFGMPLPMVEQGIALSVIVMGLAVASGVKMPVGFAMALVAVFAVFHGHAHGAEGAGAGSFLGYAAGFVVATSLLHAVGVVLGLMLERLGSGLALNSRRLAGATGALAGAAILIG